MSNTIQSAFRIKSTGVILRSAHVHDYFEDSRAPGWFIDGGNEYLRMGYPEGFKQEDIEMLNLTNESSVQDVFAKAVWGTRGKNGKSPLKYVLVSDMELEHIEAVLQYQPRISPYLKIAMSYWVGFKKGSSRSQYSANY